jgi:hypothetical protein
MPTSSRRSADNERDAARCTRCTAASLECLAPEIGGRRACLGAVAANRNSPQKHVWRASIILLTADGLGTNAIMRGTGRSKSVVWRWQDRFMQEGVAGLLRDKTRPAWQEAARRRWSTGVAVRGLVTRG